MKQAQDIFHVNVLLYPTSANVYDSYAEASLKLGDKALALTNYKRAAAMDPKNTNAARVVQESGEGTGEADEVERPSVTSRQRGSPDGPRLPWRSSELRYRHHSKADHHHLCTDHGERLVSLFEKYELGLKPKTVYELVPELSGA